MFQCLTGNVFFTLHIPCAKRIAKPSRVMHRTEIECYSQGICCYWKTYFGFSTLIKECIDCNQIFMN